MIHRNQCMQSQSSFKHLPSINPLFRAMIFSVSVCFIGISLAQAAPPADFQITQIIGSGLDGPSAFEFAPDGRIFILERTGAIKIYKNGSLLPTPFVELPSIASGDRGLIGIAFDPNFSSNHYVYFYYTGLDQLNRLVRFDASGDTATEDPFILYQTAFPSELLHVGGSIRFGTDGKLYFAVGDNGNPPLAQQLDNPHGKILRINKDGTIPSDNPFVNTPGALGEIFAYGLRNPWRFQFDSATDRLYVGDVGNFTWEEINLVRKGANYGWPLHEGECIAVCAGFVDPEYTYNHNGQSAAVTGGPIYRGTMFPETYRGALFFSDYAQGFIRYMHLDGEGHNAGVFDFDTNAGSVVDLKTAQDGSIYYVTYFPGRLYRITYATDNHLPIANASADVVKGIEPLTVGFSSLGSSDPDGDALTYAWDFGDGTGSTNPNPSKVFTAQGTYTVQLTVSDGLNFAQAIPIAVQVGFPPIVTLAAPNDGDTFRAGDLIRYQAAAIDGVGNDLNDAAILTDVVLHHDTHIHPFLSNLIGRTNEFRLPKSGEAASNIWYEIRTTATDTNGLSATQSVNIYPLKSDMTFQTVPSGLAISLEGSPYQAPRTITGVVGFERQLGVPSPQAKDGISYQFNHWLDGGAQARTLITPESDTTYTAVFTEAQRYAAEYFSNQTLSGTPSLTRTDMAINFDWGGGSPDGVVPIDNFSARWSKTETFTAGDYEFTATADDGIRVYVDDVAVIDHWIDQGPTTYTTTRSLTAGSHVLRVEYYENAGGAVAQFGFTKVGGTVPPPSTVWVGSYWNTPAAGAAPAIPVTPPTLTQNETAIDFDWGDISPNSLVSVDHFVAQWTKNDTFEAGTYRFTTASDDGIRVFLDGASVIDQWNDHAETIHTADVVVTAGTHALRVDFYERTGGAVAKASYAKIGTTPPPVPTTGFTSEFFPNQTLSGTPSLTRTDMAINFDWGGGSPDGVVPIDNFSARWSKTETFTAGDYEFTATADDGIRVYVDDVAVIDHWIDQGPTTYTTTRSLTAGSHVLRVEYYENAGGAVAQFGFTKVGGTVPPPSTVWVGSYWNTPAAGAAPAIPVTPPTLTQNETAIDFDWGDISPNSLVSVDHFVAQWTKNDTFEAGTYRFTTASDDGIRVFLDGASVIDQWNDHAETIHTADVVVTAGTHALRVDFYERTGGAVAKASYAKIGTTPPPVPTTGFTSEFFPNQTLSGTPSLTRTDMAINFDWGGGSPDGVVPIDNFSARFTQTATFIAGNYLFEITADDGVRLYVDGALILDHWIDQPPTAYQVTQALTAGSHTLVLEYYERSGGAVVKMGQSLP